MPDLQHYGLILTDPLGEDIYAYSFTDEELWLWVDEHVSFEDGEPSRRIAIPGLDRTISVTAGSWYNDKLLALTSADRGHPHPNLNEVEGYDYDTVFSKLLNLAGRDYILEGLIY